MVINRFGIKDFKSVYARFLLRKLVSLFPLCISRAVKRVQIGKFGCMGEIADLKMSHLVCALNSNKCVYYGKRYVDSHGVIKSGFSIGDNDVVLTTTGDIV